MKNNKTLGIVLWAAGLVFVHLVVFLIPRQYSASLWITYGFTVFAFISQLTVWLYLWRVAEDAHEQFLYFPSFTISILFLIAQMLICLISLFVAMPVKVAILVNALPLIIVIAVLAMALISKNAIHRLDSRQKNHHVEL